MAEAAMGGIELLAANIGEELRQRLPGQRKTQRENLALLVATMLEVRSANLVELAAALPRAAERIDMRYQWIARVLANPLIDCNAVMAPFGREVLTRAAGLGRVELILDQSKLSERHQMLMLALRLGERAVPLAWCVEQTTGPIGLAQQRRLLDLAATWLPGMVEVVVLADRFYGTPGLIAACAARGWDYRLRLKGSLRVFLPDRAVSVRVGDLVAQQSYLTGVELTAAHRVRTNIGVIHDPGHDEPWIVAMSAKPGYLTTLDYSKRWGIEPMFSDFKSRGFGLDDTQIRYPDRLARLVLVMALALYCAVSTGMWDQANHPLPAEIRPEHKRPKKVARSLTSSFTRGLRRIAALLQAALPMPPLWAASG
jgi:Transposase DDE domain